MSTAAKIKNTHDDTGSALHVNLITEHGSISGLDWAAVCLCFFDEEKGKCLSPTCRCPHVRGRYIQFQ